MKSFLLFIAAFTFCLTGICQGPDSFNYQLIVHDITGKIVPRHQVDIKISILSGKTDDSVVYSEKHHVTTNRAGLVSIFIGEGTDKTGNFTSLDWNNNKYFLNVKIDSGVSSDFIDFGTTQIMHIPYNEAIAISKQQSSDDIENKLFISRRFVGSFVDYRHTGPHENNGPNIIWIKTTLENSYGKISAYSKKCSFSVGDRLYLRRAYYTPGGVFGFWVYQIENDSSVYYRVTEFQHDRKMNVESWFN